jgi:hypothetical protein
MAAPLLTMMNVRVPYHQEVIITDLMARRCCGNLRRIETASKMIKFRSPQKR